MKKVMLLVFVLFVGVINLNARDMSGRFGLGIGWDQSVLAGVSEGMITTPNAAITKIGLGPNLVLEPSVSLGFEGYEGETATTLLLGAALNYIIASHAKTNVYLGGGLVLATQSPPVGDGPTSFGLMFGIGLEHFISEYYSLDLSLESGFMNTSVGEISNSETYIGNQRINFGMVWYY